ncbi:hypothetical protein BKA56DRAFT_677979 [Ilyonectria sp. MPI-CAGE-AT-0026]|nr:hypothetical protein BKA56DRAFT_677979 [Ilyonectria sp. MPI-CAGE-AT-0026]
MVGGKAKYLDLSEVSSVTLRPSGTNLLDTCVELGVSVFAYALLGRGILTGRFRSVDDFEEGGPRRSTTRFQGDNLKKNLVVVEKCNELAEPAFGLCEYCHSGEAIV